MRGNQRRSTSLFSLESLEERQLMTWGAFPTLIHQDQAITQYPAITGKGQVIVDLDSGVNLKHGALAGRIWTNPGEIPGNGIDDEGDGKVDDVRGWNFAWNSNDVNDYQGHGTMTAGIMVANHFVNTGNYHGYAGDGREYQGIASGAQVLPLRIVNTNGTISASAVEAALKWVIANRVRFNITAINMSLDVGQTGYNAVKDELQTLWESGVFIGAASGNGGNTADWLSYPAKGPYAASVGAINSNDTINSVTSRGPSLELLAPGNQIPYLDQGYTYWLGGAGTSYATPFVTAASTLIKQVNPAFTSDQILQVMMDSGKPIYDPVTRLTFKRLDIQAAVALAFSRSAPITPEPATTPPPVPTPTPTPVPTPTPIPTRSAFTTIQAESYTSQTGLKLSGNGIGYVDGGDWVGYKGLDFGQGATSFSINLAVADAYAGKQIELRLGGQTGAVVGILTVQGTGGWGVFKTQTIALTTPITGVQDLYLNFAGADGVANIDSFKFA